MLKNSSKLKLTSLVEEIIKRIDQKNGQVYLVGGCVRDFLLGLDINDYDLTTSLIPDEVVDLFKDYHIIESCKKYGTIFIRDPRTGEEVEITTFRKDLEYFDGRRPEAVSFSTSLEEDLKRRDFTINAICYHPNKGFIDPLNGMKDLEIGIIKTVGRAKERFNEDRLRIMRAFRFHAKLGFRLDDEIISAVKEMPGAIIDISEERFQAEFSKLILGDYFESAFKYLIDLDQVKYFSYHLSRMANYDQKSKHHHLDLMDHTLAVMAKTKKDLITRLAALFHDVGKPDCQTFDENGEARYFHHQAKSSQIAIDFLRHFRYPNQVVISVSKLIERHMDASNIYTQKSVKKLYNRMEEDIYRLFDLQRADSLSTKTGDGTNIDRAEEILKSILENHEATSLKGLAINGFKLIEIGYKEGKMIGNILSYLMDQVLENPELNQEDLLINLVKTKFKISGGVMKKYFGTDGIRGVANEELTPELAYRVGRAAAYKLADGEGKILIGRDTRHSGDMLNAALTAGILSQGLDVVDLGIITTPAVASLTTYYKARAGVVISASHNPFEFNGIKFFSSSGFKLPDELELEIEDLIENPEKIDLRPIGMQLGKYEKIENGVRDYIDYLKTRISVGLENLKISVDCGHGATLVAAKALFSELGADVIMYNDDYSGSDINDNCGSTNPKLIQEAVVRDGSDLGLSFDGDGDRLIAVDEKGRIMDGDHFLAAVGKYMKKDNKLNNNGIVGTVMSNIGLEEFGEKNSIDIIRASVGDRYVLEEMQKGGYSLGGEQSGHFIFLDDITTGDGMLSALKLIEVMKKNDLKLSELNDLMTSYPQVLKNAKVPNDKKKSYMEDPVIKAEIEKIEAEFNGKGRVLIRPSGTEPLVRVMLEGEDLEILNKKSEELAKIIEERMN